MAADEKIQFEIAGLKTVSAETIYIGLLNASKGYIKELEFYQFQISTSRNGNPYDNAFAESFMKILKSEEVHL